MTVTADDVDLAVIACHLLATADTPAAVIAARRLTVATALAHAAPGAGFDNDIRLYRAVIAQLTPEQHMHTLTRPRLGDIGIETEEEREIIPLPATVPAPVPEPTPEPTPAPAPATPEKVPA